ncbi:hypothetical protein EG329_003088 [Mollisiaceae sp. DMI_Dod_QoI]|nr:hypothetical protein EG329_003088 [Helotiales sp. DMI_Dod_QoI]
MSSGFPTPRGGRGAFAPFGGSAGRGGRGGAPPPQRGSSSRRRGSFAGVGYGASASRPTEEQLFNMDPGHALSLIPEKPDSGPPNPTEPTAQTSQSNERQSRTTAEKRRLRIRQLENAAKWR